MKKPSTTKSLTKVLTSIFIASSLFATQAHAIGEDDILGKWKLVDHTSGAIKAKGKFFKDNTGSYNFKIIEVSKQNFSGRKSIKSCEGCPGKFNNKPLQDMTIMWGFKAKDHDYMQGSGIDPWKKKAYKSDLHLNDAKNMIKVRKGYSTKNNEFNFGRTYYLVKAD